MMGVAIVATKNCNIRDVISRSPVAGLAGAEETLRRWLKTSEEVWLGMHDGRVACIWGLAPPTTISNRAYLWLLTTDLVNEHKFVFIRHSQLVIEDTLKRYPLIVGHVGADNALARRWLRWLGAEVGPSSQGFSPFTIRRK